MLALPIMGGAVSQSLLNIVDTFMVSGLGENALAGVGIGGYATFMSTAIVIGIGSAVQTMVARRIGEGREHVAAEPLMIGILLVFLIGIPVYLLLSHYALETMSVLNNDPAVIAIAAPYYAIRMAGLFAVGMNFCFRGYWTGVSRPMIYMRTLILMHACNIIISYGLIYGKFGLPEMGTNGAAVGTSLSLYIGSILYAVQCSWWSKRHGYLKQMPTLRSIRPLVRLTLPSSAQQFFFATGLTMLFWIIGRVGTEELAVAHVLINLVLFLILPAIGLGMAATTLVSECMGDNNPEAAYSWGWDVTKLAMFLLFLCGIPMWYAPETVLGLFFHDTALIELGRLPLRITGIAIFVDGMAIVLTNSLIGAGAAKDVMKVNVSIQWLAFLPLAYVVGPIYGMGLIGIWLLQVCQRLATSAILGSLWSGRRWALAYNDSGREK